MDQRKRIKQRIILNVFFIVLGIGFIVSDGIFHMSASNILQTFGCAYIVCGAVQLWRNLKFIRDPELMRKLEIAEKDERNLMLLDKARSFAFAIYVTAASVAVMVLYIMDLSFAAYIIAGSICFMVFSFWLCYHILKRKY